MCWHCYFCSQNKIAGKITCKRQGEVCPQRFKPRCWLSRLGALHWGGRGHPSGVGVVSSWVTADRGLFPAPPRAGWGAWGSLRVSSLNQKEQQSLLRSALRCELEMDEDLIMHPRQPSPQLPAPAHAIGRIWQPTQRAAHLSPKNLLCPSPLSRRAGRCVCRSPDNRRPTLGACSDTDSRRCPGVCLTLHPPLSMDVFTAQDVSKRPARSAGGVAGTCGCLPGLASLLFALAHATLSPASSSLRHLLQTPWFSGWPDFLSLLLVFCSCLCFLSCPAGRDVSIVRLR